MFIEHFGLSFGSKKIAPQVSLGTMLIATQFVDILWPFFLVAGAEQMAVVPGYTAYGPFEFVHYPYTHSLFMNVVWGLVAGAVYGLIKKDWKGALIVGLGVLSHWFLDLIVHIPDLPWSPWGQSKVGFGLWNHVAATWIIESIIFFGGVYFYTSATKAKNNKGRWGLWTLVTLLFLFAVSSFFSPPPSGSLVTLLISMCILMGVIVALGYWVDSNRESV